MSFKIDGDNQGLKYLPRVFKFFKPHSKWGFLSIALLVISTLVGLLLPWPMKILVDNVLGGRPLPGILAEPLQSISTNRVSLMLAVVLAGFALSVLQSFLTIITTYVNTRLDTKMVLDFRTALFAHSQRLSMSFHDRRRAGMLIYVINSQSDAAAKMVMTIPQLGQSVLTLVGMFWIFFRLDWQLALVSLTVVPFLYYSVGYYAKRIQPRLYRVRMMEGESLSIVHEAISMLRVIMAFCREDHEMKRFRNQSERAVEARVRLTVRQTLFSFAVNTLTAAGTALVLGIAAYHVMQNRVSIGDIWIIMAYLASVYKPLETISTTIGAMQDIFISLQIGFEILDTQPDIQDKPEALPITCRRGEVVFENISFNYEGRKDTLRNVSFEAKPGEAIGIVGPTGAGKTTLVSLLPRFYTPSGGRIFIDGQEIRDVTLESLRKSISIVLQDPMLFSASVAENIRYGRLDASLDDIIEAAKNANAHDFIMRLPQQYDTELGERGAQLSTGERQRIAVARAFLKGAPILILDEPTSSIDSKTEAVILDALDRLMQGRTTFIIAHRLSGIRYSDRILVMNQGQLVEQGTHATLLEARGIYYQLYQFQTTQRKTTRSSTPTAELAAAERA